MRGELLRAKRGQSSVEYLGTYAWAFFGLIMTVGALNYFGVFDPSGYAQEHCTSGSQLSCEDAALYWDDETGEATVLLMIQNNYPRTVVVSEARLKNLLEGVPAQQGNLLVEPGRTITFTFKGDREVVPGQKEQADFTITYHRYQGTAEHNITGTSTINVQAQPQSTPYCGDSALAAGEECDPPTQIEGAGNWISAQCGGAKSCRSDCTCA